MKAALAIGCDPAISTERISIVTASSVEYAAVVCLSSITCLGYQMNNSKVICHDLPPQSSVDGLLGMDVIGQLSAFQKFRDSIFQFLL
jgi:predicted aspartyl protease